MPNQSKKPTQRAHGKSNSSNAPTLSVNSFFAGIGGFDLAFERLGFQTSFLCENNRFCQAVLRRHWPTVPLVSDIRELASRDIPAADVWTAGFPCQDLSLARTPHGRLGFKGKNSSLFFKFCELASEQRPKIIVIENVAGLLNAHGGLDFHVLLRSLNDLGYAVAWRVLNARYFGVPQSRPRIFIIAWRKAPELASRVLFEDSPSPAVGCERTGFLEEHRCPLTAACVPAVSFCISATSGRHTGLDWARSYVTYDHGVRRLTPRECERLQGLPDDWTIPGEDHPIPIKGIDTDRYHAIGNAVCVPVAEWVARRLKSVIPRPSQRSRPAPELRLANCTAGCHLPMAPVADLGHTTKWLTGGCVFDGEVLQSRAPSAPAVPKTALMVSIVDSCPPGSRYFLSDNAAQGIIRRVDKMKRKLFGPMDRVLRKMAKGDLPDGTRQKRLAFDG